MDSLEKDEFNWEDLSEAEIKKRNKFIEIFVSDHKEIEFLYLLNTSIFEKIFTLKYLELIVCKPNFSYGMPIYNESLNFYTILLEFFNIYYLKRDFALLDKIDAQDIEITTPIIRTRVQEKNRNNEVIFLINMYIFYNDYFR